MNTIKSLKSKQSQSGKLDWIGLRPQKKAPLSSVVSADLDTETGLEGDHYSKKGGHRMVTLIQAEHLDAIAAFLGKKPEPGLIRRNLVVSNINLISLHDSQFKIGNEVILEGTGFCHPCSRMEENLGEGGFNAMRGHGGITARVIRGGKIGLGDDVEMIWSVVDTEHITN